MTEINALAIESPEFMSKVELTEPYEIMDDLSLSTSSSSSSSKVMYSFGNQSKTSIASNMSDSVLDHSHLKPGTRASLLSYSQTINMYRTNAKKTNNQDIQSDFAAFLIQAGKQSAQDDDVPYFAEAEKILKKLSVNGHPHGQYQLAKLYVSGILNTKKHGKPDYNKAFPLFVQASKRLHMDATFHAAECYEKGWGCRSSGNKAILFYKKAASLGHPAAMYRLGLAFINGELGLQADTRECMKWFSRAVEAATPEYPEAVYKLANLYSEGISNMIYVDYAYSVELLNRAAEMGYAPAAFKLGECYEYGKLDCHQDPALSIHYYTMAAERGDRDACFALTAWYLVGCPDVLPQSDDKAFIWAQYAAELGLPKAEYAMGYLYEKGIGCEANDAIAIDWYQKAAKHGDSLASDRLKVKGCQLPTTANKRKDDCIIM